MIKMKRLLKEIRTRVKMEDRKVKTQEMRKFYSENKDAEKNDAV